MARIPGIAKRRRQGELLVGVTVIQDEWPEHIKDAVAIRNATWIDGQCPHCGAARKLTAYVGLGMVGVTFLHADGCPVTELLLDPEAT